MNKINKLLVLFALVLFAQGTAFGQNICRIGSEEFATLNAAVTYAREYMGGTATIEMLTDYSIPNSDKVTLNQTSDHIIITTASTGFTPSFGTGDGRLDTDGNRAIIKRGNLTNSFFVLSANGTLTFEDIILDGNNVAVSEHGGLVNANNGLVTVRGGTIMRNTRMNDGKYGAAIYSSSSVANSVTIDNAVGKTVEFRNCVTLRDGGAIRVSYGCYINNAGTLVFEECKANYGGAIEANETGCYITIVNSGTITFKKCTTTTGSNNGGALNSYRGPVTITNNNAGVIRFDECTAKTEGGAIYAGGNVSITNNDTSKTEFISCTGTNGGAIYAAGNVSITNNNTLGTEFVSCTGTNGGAIYQNGTGNMSITNCNITDCSASSGKGGGIWTKTSSLSMTSTTIYNCNAYSNGGAVYHVSTVASPSLYMTGCIIQNNQLTYNNASAQGGGIYSNAKTVGFHNSLNVSGNKLASSTVANAGGIYFTKEDVVITVTSDGTEADLLIYNNYTSDGTTQSNMKMGVISPGFLINCNTLKTNDGRKIGIVNPSATDRWFALSQQGLACGDAETLANYFISDIGIYTAIYNDTQKRRIVWGPNNGPIICKITDSSGILLYYEFASGRAPAEFQNLGDAFGAFGDERRGPFTYSDNSVAVPYNIEMLVTSYTQNMIITIPDRVSSTPLPVTLKTDLATAGGRCTITRGDFSGSMYVMDDYDVFTLADIIIDGNKGSKTCNQNGGIIRADGSTGTLTLESGCTLQNSKTSLDGGAVHMLHGDFYMQNGVEIVGCEAVNGGGAYLSCNVSFNTNNADSPNAFISCTASSNTASPNGGGGLYYTNTSGSLVVKGATFSGCTASNTNTDANATASGGGIWTDAVSLTIGDDGEQNKVSFVNCSAKTNGGGIYCSSYNVILDHVVFGGNETNDPCTVSNQGGAVYSSNNATGNALMLTNCQIIKCTAVKEGGGIYTRGNTTLSAVTITGCVGYSGGAVYCASTSTALTLKNNTSITDNRLASNSGARILAAGIFMASNSSQVTFGATGITNDVITIKDNETQTGEASNLRLAMDGLNNTTTSVRVLSELTGEIHIVNAGKINTQFGSEDSEKSYTVSDVFFSDLPNRTTERRNNTQLFWVGDPICKITNASGELLTIGDNQAVYYTLKDAFEAFGSGSFSGTPANIEIMKQYYILEEGITVPNKDIILKTAGTTGPYPYQGAAGTKCTVYRGNTANNASMFLLSNAKSLTLANIILDGQSNHSQFTTGKGSAVQLNKSGANLTIKADAYITNAECTTSSGLGGGVYMIAGSTLTMESRTEAQGAAIRDCKAYQGGGVYDAGTGTRNVANWYIKGCQASNNGGGIYYSATSALTIDPGTSSLKIEDCSAANGGGIYGNADVSLGANASFTGCSATTNGGGLYVTKAFTANNNPSFTSCTAGTNGGGVYLNNSQATYTDSMTGGATFTSCTAGTNGGGMYAPGKSSTYRRNFTIGGTITFTNCTAGSTGGGLYKTNGTLTINENSSITAKNCRATSSHGGGIYKDGTGDLTINQGVSFTFGGTGTGEGCSAGGNGGGMYCGVAFDASAANISVTATNCSAAYGGGIYGSAAVTLGANVSFTGCSATTSGGGVYVNTTFTANGNPSFTSCTAGTNGGGIYLHGGNSANYTDSMTGGATFTSCTAGTNGGGLCAAGKSASYMRSFTIGGTITFTNCTAGTGGGGLYKTNGPLTINENSSITAKGCQATTGNGGGIYKDATGDLTINQGVSLTFGGTGTGEGCSAGGSGGGGGIYCGVDFDASVNNVSFTATNCSAYNGGGAYFAKIAKLNGASITGNSASNQGGGIYAKEGLTLLGSTTVEDNTLTTNTVDNGAGIYMNNNKTLTIGATTDGDSGNSVIVASNSVSNGDASNVRLAAITSGASAGNNWASSVSILSKMNGLVGVCNPGALGSQLGTQPSAQLVDPLQNPRILSDYDSRVAVTDPNTSTTIVWEGDYVCKITDAEGHLLTYTVGSSTYDAKFFSLWQAFDQINSNHINGTPAYIKMLCDYAMRKPATLSTTTELTLTTAGTVAAEEDDLIYTGAGTTATLYKGLTNATMLTISAANEQLTLLNINIDGRTEAAQSSAPWKTGGMFLANAANATLNIGEGTALQNIKVKNGNRTLHIQNGAKLNILPGSTFDHCEAKVSGGVAYVTGSASTLNMTGGTVRYCNSTQSGGVFYINDGTLNITGTETDTVVFETCHSGSYGGVIYQASGDLTINYARFGKRDADENVVVGDVYASISGGAVCAYTTGVISINHSEFLGCRTTEDTNTEGKGNGGGVYISNNDAPLLAEVKNCLFEKCRAERYGGGIIFEQDNGTATTNGCTFINCYAYRNGGGGLYTETTGTVVEDCTFEDCYTSNNGGGLWINAGGTVSNVNINGHIVLDAATKNATTGGGIYVGGATILNGCDIFSNSASSQGGGVYANANLTLKNGTSVTVNKLTSNTVGNGAGIYMADGVTLILGGAGITNEYSTVTGNETNNGNDSNVRLARNDSNNSATAVDVQSKLVNYIGVCNPGNEGTKFGTHDISGGTSSATTGLNFIVSDDNTLRGAVGTEVPGGYVVGDVCWFTITAPTTHICKITDNEGHLLKYDSNIDATFPTLSAAVSALQTKDFNYSGAAATPTHIKMLVDEFEVVSKEALAVGSRSFILTTAEKEGDPGAQAPYYTGTGATATIYKGRIPVGTNGIFNLNNTAADVTLTFENIIMDGRTNNEVPMPTLSTTANGACIASTSNSSADVNTIIVLGQDATIQNCRTSSSGAFYVVNGGELQIENGSLINNCINNSNGGAVRVTGSGSTLTMTGGTIQDCGSKSSGGAFYVTGKLEATSGTFSGCEAVGRGGAIYSSTSGQTTTLTLCQFEDCASNIYNNSSYATVTGAGGAVCSDNPLEIYGCNFKNITSGISDGGAVNVEEYGVSLHIDEYVDSEGTHTRTVFENCTSGRYGAGALFEPNTGFASLKHTDFINCVCSKTGTSGGGGGGFWTDSPQLEVEDCTFTNCQSGGYGGGGLYQYSSSTSYTTTMRDCVFTNCEATTNNGGGLVLENTSTVENCTVTSCSAKANGGGLYFSGGTLTLSGLVKIDDNTKSTNGSLNNVYKSSSNKTISIGTAGLDCGSHIGMSNVYSGNNGNNKVVATGSEANCLAAGANRFFFDDKGMYEAYCLSHTDPDYTTDKIYFIGSWRNHSASSGNDIIVSGDEITVKSEAGLAYIAKQVNGGETYAGKTVKLDKDLNLNDYLWEPIGLVYPCACDDDRPFKGTFNGQGHTISNLRSFLPHAAMGLFGLIGEGGTVKNIFIESGNLECTYTDGSKDVAYLGGLAGELDKSTIAYSEAHVTMSGTSSVMGGLVGKVTGTPEKPSTIHSSMAMSEMSGVQTMGGLVGTMDANSTLANSFANAKFTVISGTPAVGGLVGENAGTVENCYTRLRDSEPSNFGWLAGTNSGTIQYCYAPKPEEGNPTYVASGTGTVSDCNAYSSTKLPSGKYGYDQAHKDDVKIGGATGTPLMDLLNTGAGSYAQWTRTMASPINNDYPVLMMPAFDGVTPNVCLGSKDGIFISYNANLNKQIQAYNEAKGGGNIYLYDTPAKVTESTGSGVRVIIDENVGITQEDGTTLTARVGVTFDNSDASGQFGKPYDWHMFSSALEEAPLGLEYHTAQSGYPGVSDYYVWNNYSEYASSGIPDAVYQVQSNMDPPKVTFWQTDNPSGYSYYNGSGDNMIGYFPTDAPYGPWRTDQSTNEGFDFYSYSEPNCHWVNFKREGKSGLFDHWHQDADTDTPEGFHYQIKYTNEKNLKPGRGYLAAIGKESMLMADGVLNNGEIVNDSISFSTGLWGYQEALKGINLVGNPYQSYLDFQEFAKDGGENSGKILDNAYYMVDADHGDYITYPDQASSNPEYAPRYIHPHQGFFVFVPSGTTQLKFTNDMRVAGKWEDGLPNSDPLQHSNFRDERLNYPLINLICHDGNGKRDLTTVEINRPETAGARKMKGLRLGDALLYAHFENRDYQALFAPVGVTEVPVRFEAFEDGVYTMKWSMYNGDFHYVHLIDNLTGADIDLLSANEYKFQASTEDYVSRFRLVFDVTGINEQEAPEPEEGPTSFAFQFGNELIVNGQGTLQFFDLNGRCLLSTRVSGEQSSVALPKVAKGVYLLRLTGSKQTQVQKIIIK